jgi:hypothetical protein
LLMENARPSSLREDIWPRSDRALLGRGEFTKRGEIHRKTDSPCFICFASQAGVALS